MIGLTESYYHACQAVMWSKSIAMVDQLVLKNTFIWKKLVLKFPGT